MMQQGYAHPIVLPPTSGKATTAMILGLMGLLTCGFTSLPAIILGHMAEAETRTGTRGGRGMAITGLVFGYLTAIPWIIFWGLVITGAVAAPFAPTPSITPYPT
jgi:hypothetical protein